MANWPSIAIAGGFSFCVIVAALSVQNDRSSSPRYVGVENCLVTAKSEKPRRGTSNYLLRLRCPEGTRVVEMEDVHAFQVKQGAECEKWVKIGGVFGNEMSPPVRKNCKPKAVGPPTAAKTPGAVPGVFI